jgi:hypothetical protein
MCSGTWIASNVLKQARGGIHAGWAHCRVGVQVDMCWYITRTKCTGQSGCAAALHSDSDPVHNALLLVHAARGAVALLCCCLAVQVLLQVA